MTDITDILKPKSPGILELEVKKMSALEFCSVFENNNIKHLNFKISFKKRLYHKLIHTNIASKIYFPYSGAWTLMFIITILTKHQYPIFDLIENIALGILWLFFIPMLATNLIIRSKYWKWKKNIIEREHREQMDRLLQQMFNNPATQEMFGMLNARHYFNLGVNPGNPNAILREIEEDNDSDREHTETEE